MDTALERSPRDNMLSDQHRRRCTGSHRVVLDERAQADSVSASGFRRNLKSEFLHVALFSIAGSKTFAVQRGLVCFRSPHPQLDTIREADPQRGSCIGEGAGNVAELVFALDI